MEEKLERYERFVLALERAGWGEVFLQVIPVGATGLLGEGVHDEWKELRLALDWPINIFI